MYGLQWAAMPHTADCAGWDPVGDNSSKFTGSFDGKGYVISNLYANVSLSAGLVAYAGLFGYLDTSASIKNVGLTELRTTASSSGAGGGNAGGLAGWNEGTISNSYSTGSVSIMNGDGGGSAGGLVGYNAGTISNSYAAAGSVEIVFARSLGGGLVGSNAGTISNSYAAMDSVSATANEPVAGGLVGDNFNGTITNSYATGSVSVADAFSSSSAGGLVGNNVNSEAKITKSYAAVDSVSAMGGFSGNYSGGLVGGNASGAIIDNTNYWDNFLLTMPAVHCGNDSDSMCSAIGLTTSEMQATSGTYPANLGPAFSLGNGYPKLYQCEIDPATNACVPDSFLDELVPGQ